MEQTKLPLRERERSGACASLPVARLLASIIKCTTGFWKFSALSRLWKSRATLREPRRSRFQKRKIILFRGGPPDGDAISRLRAIIALRSRRSFRVFRDRRPNISLAQVPRLSEFKIRRREAKALSLSLDDSDESRVSFCRCVRARLLTFP